MLFCLTSITLLLLQRFRLHHHHSLLQVVHPFRLGLVQHNTHTPLPQLQVRVG